jgi:hypothetical protein
MAFEDPSSDQDLISPYTEESARRALESGDVAHYSLWYRQEEIALGNHPTPTAQADLLVRAAKIYRSIGEIDGATQLLKRAAQLVRGSDAQMEQLVVTFLREVGGEKAVGEVAAEAAREVRSRSARIQRELIDVQTFGTQAYDQFGGGPEADQRRTARVAELKTQYQEVVDALSRSPKSEVRTNP